MTQLLGIDLGTSSVKAVVIDERGQLLGTGSQEYPIHVPQTGWAEQSPQDWWNATTAAVRQAINQSGNVPVRAIGLSGQMHGTVLVDRASQPIASAIIWPDQRSASEVDELMAVVGAERFAEIAGTAPAAGFMAATLRWLQNHDRAKLEQAHYCLLPKDYVRLCLTGNIATDASDGSGTALFDTRRRCWSIAILQALDLPAPLFPTVLQSSDRAGTLLAFSAREMGLPPGIPVVAGCADQPAQAVGNGLIDPGKGSITIGTGGQLFAPLSAPPVDKRLQLHVFCHAPEDRWYLLGAMLAAGLSLRWFRDLLGLTGEPDSYQQLSAAAATIEPGAGGLLFLPYLVGERAPLRDPRARGTFVGVTLQHGRGHLARAIMEGVAFALRQILETMLGLGAQVDRLIASGNGLGSQVWRQITADVLARPLQLSLAPERAGVGAALIAGIGAGVYADYAQAREAAAASFEITEPNPASVTLYEERYQQFLSLYPLLKPIMHDLSAGKGFEAPGQSGSSIYTQGKSGTSN